MSDEHLTPGPLGWEYPHGEAQYHECLECFHSHPECDGDRCPYCEAWVCTNCLKDHRIHGCSEEDE